MRELLFILELSPITSGPIVNDSLETSIEGVFACGNVLHVHDLVDFVSEEAAAAGKNAARYIRECGQTSDMGSAVKLCTEGIVRYTVPKTIHIERMEDELTVRFRVGAVQKNCYVSAYFDEERVIKKRRPVVAPGEMEEVKLKKEMLLKYPDLKKITFRVEEA